jgi:hypothetical protein
MKYLVLTFLIQNLTIVRWVIIKHSLAEVNVSCTVPSFVNLAIPTVAGNFFVRTVDTELYYNVLGEH